MNKIVQCRVGFRVTEADGNEIRLLNWLSLHHYITVGLGLSEETYNQCAMELFGCGETSVTLNQEIAA